MELYFSFQSYFLPTTCNVDINKDQCYLADLVSACFSNPIISCDYDFLRRTDFLSYYVSSISSSNGRSLCMVTLTIRMAKFCFILTQFIEHILDF